MNAISPSAVLLKAFRVLWRLTLLSLAIAVFTLLTSTYARTLRTPMPIPRWRPHRSLTPKMTQIPEFLGEGVLIAACTVAGRIIFRLRLSSPAPGKEQRLQLSLHRKARDR